MTARLIAALAVVLALAGSAEAATYKVCATVAGDCTHDCSTVQAQLTAAVNDDVFEFEEGLTCTLAATLTVPARTGVILRGLGTGAVIDGNNAVASVIKGYTGTIVDNLTVRNSTGVGIEGNGATRTFAIQDVTIENTAGDAVYRNSGTIERVTITGAGAFGINGTTSSTIARNVVIVSPGSGCFTASGAAALVEHLTCVGSTGGNYAVYALNGAVFGSILAGNASAIAGLRTAAGTYNDVHGTTGGIDYYIGSDGTGSVSLDPLFVGAPDYSLAAGSPAIDTATGSTVTLDRLSVTRDASPDMGAYEYVSSGLGAGVWGADGVMGEWGGNGTMGARGGP